MLGGVFTLYISRAGRVHAPGPLSIFDVLRGTCLAGANPKAHTFIYASPPAERQPLTKVDRAAGLLGRGAVPAYAASRRTTSIASFL